MKNEVVIRPHRIKGNDLVVYTDIKIASDGQYKMMLNRLSLFSNYGEPVYGLGFDVLDENDSIVDTVNVNKKQFEYMRKHLKFKVTANH